MKGLAKIWILVFLFYFEIGLVEAQTEERPQWAPRSEKHRNTRDELGRKQGLWKFFSYSKVLIYEVTFANDVKHGPAIRHNSSTGIVTEESNYYNGIRDGDYKRYTYNGTLTLEGQYSSGKRTGQWTTYYPVNGEKRNEGAYELGQKTGKWQYFSSKGKISTEGDYKKGLRDGTWVYYAEDGSKTAEKKFVNGKEIGVVSTQPVTSKKPKPKPKKSTKKNQPTQTGRDEPGTDVTPQ